MQGVDARLAEAVGLAILAVDASIAELRWDVTPEAEQARAGRELLVELARRRATRPVSSTRLRPWTAGRPQAPIARW